MEKEIQLILIQKGELTPEEILIELENAGRDYNLNFLKNQLESFAKKDNSRVGAANGKYHAVFGY